MILNNNLLSHFKIMKKFLDFVVNLNYIKSDFKIIPN